MRPLPKPTVVLVCAVTILLGWQQPGYSAGAFFKLKDNVSVQPNTTYRFDDIFQLDLGQYVNFQWAIVKDGCNTVAQLPESEWNRVTSGDVTIIGSDTHCDPFFDRNDGGQHHLLFRTTGYPNAFSSDTTIHDMRIEIGPNPGLASFLFHWAAQTLEQAQNYDFEHGWPFDFSQNQFFTFDFIENNNNPPVAQNDLYTVFSGLEVLQVPAPGVLQNDSPTSPVTAEIVTFPSLGVLLGGPPHLHPDGSFSYSTADNFFGFDGTDSFTYKAINEFGESNIATVTLRVATTEDVQKKDQDLNGKDTITPTKTQATIRKHGLKAAENYRVAGYFGLTADVVSMVSCGVAGFTGIGVCACWIGAVSTFDTTVLNNILRETGESNEFALLRKASIALLDAGGTAAGLKACAALTGDPVSQVAGGVILALKEMSAGAEYMAKASDQHAFDPPSSDYGLPFTVSEPNYPNDFGLDADQNLIMHNFYTTLHNAMGRNKMVLGSLERYQGALIVDDLTNARARLDELKTHDKSMSSDFVNLGHSVGKLARLCGSFCDVKFNKDDWLKVQEQVNINGGFSQEVRDFLLSANFTEAEVTAGEQRLINLRVVDFPDSTFRELLSHYAKVFGGPRAMPWLELLLLDD